MRNIRRNVYWCAAFLLSTAAQADSTALNRAFFNPSVTDAEFFQKTGTRSIDGLKSVLQSRVFRQHPSTRFNFIGVIESWDWIPPTHNHKIALNYYIPESIRFGSLNRRVPALVFLHGGGVETNTYAKAKYIATRYLEDFVVWAEDTGTILVAPSSSIGWGVHVNGVIESLLPLLRMELPVDPDHTILAGHSMGAMGITRSGFNQAERFSGILALAGGTQDQYQIEKFMRPYFNIPYTHINGWLDHYPTFKPQMLKFEKKMQELEHRMGRASRFKLFFHPSGHRYNLMLTERTLNLFGARARDLYQKKLTGYVEVVAYVSPTQEWPAVKLSRPGYFWVEAVQADYSHPARIIRNGGGSAQVDASVDSIQNRIDIHWFDDSLGTRRVRVYLSSKLVDFNRPISILFNGKEAFSGRVVPDAMKMLESARLKKDPGFLFESYVDIAI